MTKRTAKMAATVWVFVKVARDAGLDIETEWAKRGTFEFNSFNPVEINIRPDDVAKAVEKWEKVAGQLGVCRVVWHDKKPWDRFNEVYR